MAGRQYSAGSYRYGFGGKEKDDELKGSGNSYDFGDRIYDPRLGKWLAVDSRQKLYVPISSYAYGLNNPLYFIDKDGNEIYDSRGVLVTYNSTTDENGNCTIIIDPKCVLDEETQKVVDALLETPDGIDAFKHFAHIKQRVMFSTQEDVIITGGGAAHAYTTWYTKDGKKLPEDENTTHSDPSNVIKVKYSTAKLEGSILDNFEAKSRRGIILSHEDAHIGPNGELMDNGHDANTDGENSLVGQFTFKSPSEFKTFRVSAQVLLLKQITPTKDNVAGYDNFYGRRGGKNDPTGNSLLAIANMKSAFAQVASELVKKGKITAEYAKKATEEYNKIVDEKYGPKPKKK